MNASSKLCDICRRRPAIYRRRDSGEKLCVNCLRRTLIKRTKRGISKFLKLRYGALVAVLALRERIVESLVLIEIANVIEEKHGSTILVIPSDKDTFQAIRMAYTRSMQRMSFIRSPFRVTKEMECPNLMRKINLLVSQLRNTGFRIDAILTPLTLNDFFEAQLHSLLENATSISEVHPLPQFVGQGVILHPMSNILRQDIHAYALLSGIFNKLEDNILSLHNTYPNSGVTPIIKDISAEFSEYHPELVFKFVETMTLLTNLVKSN